MPTTIRLCTAAIALTLVAACDEGPTRPDSDSDFRGRTDCFETEETGSNTFAWKGWWPDDGDPWWHLAADTATLNLVREFEQSRTAGVCTEVCASNDLAWDGAACAFDSGFDAGEPDVLDERDRFFLLQGQVYAEVQFGCACG